MTAKAADLLLALNSQVKHDSPEESLKMPKPKKNKKDPKAALNAKS